MLLFLLSSPLLLIFGQEFLKTRPCLALGGTLKCTGRIGQTAIGTGQTGRLAVGLPLLVLRPEY